MSVFDAIRRFFRPAATPRPSGGAIISAYADLFNPAKPLPPGWERQVDAAGKVVSVSSTARGGRGGRGGVNGGDGEDGQSGWTADGQMIPGGRGGKGGRAGGGGDGAGSPFNTSTESNL